MMEVNSSMMNRLTTQDSLAAEVLTSLHSGSGFSPVGSGSGVSLEGLSHHFPPDPQQGPQPPAPHTPSLLPQTAITHGTGHIHASFSDHAGHVSHHLPATAGFADSFSGAYSHRPGNSNSTITRDVPATSFDHGNSAPGHYGNTSTVNGHISGGGGGGSYMASSASGAFDRPENITTVAKDSVLTTSFTVNAAGTYGNTTNTTVSGNISDGSYTVSSAVESYGNTTTVSCADVGTSYTANYRGAYGPGNNDTVLRRVLCEMSAQVPQNNGGGVVSVCADEMPSLDRGVQMAQAPLDSGGSVVMSVCDSETQRTQMSLNRSSDGMSVCEVPPWAPVNDNSGSNTNSNGAVSVTKSEMPQIPLNRGSRSVASVSKICLPFLNNISGSSSGTVSALSSSVTEAASASHKNQDVSVAVQCSPSDTIIVAGQQGWRCCMCSQVFTFDASIDQHLSTTHNLGLKFSRSPEQSGATPNGDLEDESGNDITEQRVKSPPHTGYTLLSDPQKSRVTKSHAGHAPLLSGTELGRVMSHTQTSRSQEERSHCQRLEENKSRSGADSGNNNNRSGLEREVALLMARTFTHSAEYVADHDDDEHHHIDKDVKHSQESLLLTVSPEKRQKTDSVPEATSFRAGSSSSTTSVDNRIRSRKDLKSQNCKGLKSHTYKDLKSQKEDSNHHDDEMTKKIYNLKYTCLVCRQLFSDIRSLYQHMVQQQHQGALPGKPDPSPQHGHQPGDLNVDVSFEPDLKMEVEEPDDDNSEVFSVGSPCVSPPPEAPNMTSNLEKIEQESSSEPAYEKILTALLSKGKQISCPSGRKPSLLKCFVCDQEMRNHNFYITRHAKLHTDDLCYTCKVCNTEFYHHDRYRNHMLQHGIVFSTLQDSENTRVTRSKTKAYESKSNQKMPSAGRRKKASHIPKPTTVSGKTSKKRGPKPTIKRCGKKLKNQNAKPATVTSTTTSSQVCKGLQTLKKLSNVKKNKKLMQHSTCTINGKSTPVLQESPLSGLCSLSTSSKRTKVSRPASGKRKSPQQNTSSTFSSRAEILKQATSSSSTGSVKLHQQQHFVVRCHVCGMSFQTHSQKRLHMLKHRCTFQCRYCDLKFESGAELLAHSRHCDKTGSSGSASRVGVSVVSAGVDIKDEVENWCDDNGGGGGGEVTSSAGGGQGDGVIGPVWKKDSGQAKPAKKKWTCSICDAVIVHSLTAISQHMRQLHSDIREGRRTPASAKPQPHRCRKCYRPFVSFAKLQLHMKTQHRDFEGICDVCGKTFRTKAAFRKHTLLHTTPEGKFQCPKCRFSFRYESRLEKHMRKHADRTGVCPHCGKIYISKIHLQRHISVEHLGIKDYRYKCDQCNAQFFEKLQLRDHIAYHHKGIQLYVCKFCHRGFNARPTLVRHERLEHTNYLPHKCKHCPQAFAEKSKLVAHEMTHTGMSPHKCEVCGKYFTTGSALRIHNNLHLGIRPFECSACGKAYLKKWNLQQHIRKVHKMCDVFMPGYAVSMPPPPQDVPQQ